MVTKCTRTRKYLDGIRQDGGVTLLRPSHHVPRSPFQVRDMQKERKRRLSRQPAFLPGACAIVGM